MLDVFVLNLAVLDDVGFKSEVLLMVFDISLKCLIVLPARFFRRISAS